MARARSFCFTWNNYDDAAERVVQELPALHIVYGKEVGESGTPHLQGFVRFQSQRRLSRVISLLRGAHVTVARDIQSSIAYCRKDGRVWEQGNTVPEAMGRARGGQALKDKWTDAYDAAREGRMNDIPAELMIKFGCALDRVRLKQLSADCPDSIDVLDNWWFWGPTGCGKSTAAREENPGAYFKMRNKWWDGYEYEPVVIMDDIDPSHEIWIQAFLKDWADHHKFRCELKGHSAVIRPRRIIITSQYSIEEVFKDPETRSALNRRFQVRYFPFIGPLNRPVVPVHVSADREL